MLLKFRITLLILIFILVSIPNLGQINNDMTQQNCIPISTKIYISNNFEVEIFFDETGKQCKNIIKKKIQTNTDEDYFSSILGEKIISQIIPRENRGKYIGSFNAEFSRIISIGETYDNVMINMHGVYSSSEEFPNIKVSTIHIYWKDIKCVCDKNYGYKSKGKQ